jgi:hypothetical protein
MYTFSYVKTFWDRGNDRRRSPLYLRLPKERPTVLGVHIVRCVSVWYSDWDRTWWHGEGTESVVYCILGKGFRFKQGKAGALEVGPARAIFWIFSTMPRSRERFRTAALSALSHLCHSLDHEYREIIIYTILLDGRFNSIRRWTRSETPVSIASPF